MEIEIGDYIRTKTGFIRKVKNIYMLGWAKKDETCIRINGKYKLKDIVKCSKNKLDLIEEGDFVNGIKVTSWYNYNELKTIKINTILTHEQYEQNCFRLEE